MVGDLHPLVLGILCLLILAMVFSFFLLMASMLAARIDHEQE